MQCLHVVTLYISLIWVHCVYEEQSVELQGRTKLHHPIQQSEMICFGLETTFWKTPGLPLGWVFDVFAFRALYGGCLMSRND